MENNWSHKSGANSTLYKLAMNSLQLLSLILFELVLFVYMWQNSYLQIQNIHLFPPMSPVYNPKLWMSCDRSHWSLKSNWSFTICLQISSRYFRIGIHTWHRCLHLLWLSLFCTVFWRLINFHRSIRTSFRIFHVPLKFLIQSIQFRKICDEMILRSTSETIIWFPNVAFVTLVIVVSFIGGYLLIALILSIFLKSFLS